MNRRKARKVIMNSFATAKETRKTTWRRATKRFNLFQFALMVGKGLGFIDGITKKLASEPKQIKLTRRKS